MAEPANVTQAAGAKAAREAMSGDPSGYSFRPVTADDLPMLRGWLRTPEVVRWWGDPEREAANLQEELAEPRMVMRIVSFRGQPFAYVQHYRIDVWPQAHFAQLPAGSRAIDTFVGEPDMLGRGHGASFLRLLAEQLKAEGAPVVAIDPDAENLRARRAYEKAGFEGDQVVESGEGLAILMVFAGGAPIRGPEDRGG